MFVATRHFPLFDYHRVPYAVDDRDPAGGPLPGMPYVRAAADRGGPRLYWLDTNEPGGPSTASSPGAYAFAGLPIFGPVLPPDLAEAWLARVPGWRPAPTTGGVGVWEHDDGSVFLPFDPNRAVHAVLSESYSSMAAGRRSAVLAVLRRAYYRARPLVPRRQQIAVRRAFTRVQARSAFPRWPMEPALHDFCDGVLRLAARVAGQPLATIAPWPRGYSWALVLTHDVETGTGYRNIDPIRELEVAQGYRSCWNFVPRRYEVEDAVVADLRASGFEVGVHGLYHDGRELESLSTWRRRLPEIHRYAARWGAVGFRSPGTHRVWDYMPLLQVEYDSSYPDTDPYEPMAGGCCSLLPFTNQGLVELPITLPQDFTLFTLLERTDESTWVDKTEFLRERGGMALLDTHPDYLIDETARSAYERLLSAFRTDDSAWKALPRDVARWWRRRSDSHLRQRDGSWVVEGPAGEEGRVRLVV